MAWSDGGDSCRECLEGLVFEVRVVEARSCLKVGIRGGLGIMLGHSDHLHLELLGILYFTVQSIYKCYVHTKCSLKER